MLNNYKSGQIVLFRDDLEIGIEYNGITFLSAMVDKINSVWIIDEFDETDNTFTLLNDTSGFWYSTEMLAI